MRIANRIQRITPSITLGVTARARALVEQGRDVIGFGAGEPDFDTPEPIKQAAAAAMASGLASKYTAVAGIAELRAAVAAEFSAVHGVPFAPEAVLVSTGAKQCIYNVLMALCEEGDEVIVPIPTWASHVELVRLVGATPVLLPSSAAEGFRLDVDALAQRLGPRTRALLLASPGNPTGVVYDEATLRRVAALLRERKNPDLFVLTDDLYRRLVYPPATFCSLLHVAPELRDQVVLIDGISKSYAMTGWRIGYCGGPVPLIAAIQKLQGQTTTNATTVAQYAALAALRGDQSSVLAMAAEFDARRRLMCSALAAIPGVRCPEPSGAFYCFPDVSAYLQPGQEQDQRSDAAKLPQDDVALTEWLLENAGVACVPGSGFYAPGHLRFSYATSRAHIEEGMRRVAAGLHTLRELRAAANLPV